MKPRVCLCMIVRDEAHVVGEALASALHAIDAWVVVDTGSTDATETVVRDFFAAHGMDGAFHHRPWRDFGSNRSEALELARPHGDYLLVLDADDLVVGRLTLDDLRHDAYRLRVRCEAEYWRIQLFRSACPWRYQGVVHEYPECAGGHGPVPRLPGNYHVASRHLGSRSRDPAKYARDADLLRADLERDPDNARTWFYLGQSLADDGQPERALQAYRRRVDLGGWEEERFMAALRAAGCCERLERPWPEVHEAYLAAWRMRPHRAEPLVRLATLARRRGEHALALRYAGQAVALPYPEDDNLFVSRDDHLWRGRDELALAAYQLCDHGTAFALWSALLDEPALPTEQRTRIEDNRSFPAQRMARLAATYPANLIERLATRPPRSGPVTLSITSCRRLDLFERSVNSFLNCCQDLDLIGRWLCVDDDSSASERSRMRERYPFFEFVMKTPEQAGHADSMNRILRRLETPWWLHLEDDWEFFAPLPYIGRCLAILQAEPDLGQVLFNRAYAETLDDRDLIGGSLRTLPACGLRYLMHDWIASDGDAWSRFLAELPAGARSNAHWPHYSLRPALLRVDAVRAVGDYALDSGHFELDYAHRYVAAGWRSAYLDGIHALHIGRLTHEAGRPGATANAYQLRELPQLDKSGERANPDSPPLPSTVAGKRTDAAADAALGLNWIGPFLDYSSFSQVNRLLTDRLTAIPGVALRRVQLGRVSSALAAPLAAYRDKLADGIDPDAALTIRHAWPPDWSRPRRGSFAVIQPWEFGALPRDWVEAAHEVDAFWVPSTYVRQLYVDAGIAADKVHLLPLGIDPELFRPEAAALPLATDKAFKFLFVGGTIYRKGPDLLLKAFAEAFDSRDDVCLVIKDFGIRSTYAGHTSERLVHDIRKKPQAPEILYLDQELAPQDMPGLYAACDCLVHPYRGEGFGLPVLEAMACGLPAIVTGGGATDDFVPSQVGYRILALRRHFGPAIGGLPLAGDGWLLEPDLPNLRDLLRHVHANPDEARARGRAGSRLARTDWTWHRSAERLLELTRRLAELR